MGEFAGRTVLATGAAGGIGAVTARRFAQESADVLAVDRDAQALDAAVVAMTADGLSVRACATDLRVDGAAARAVDAALAAFGHLDALVNIAGVFPGPEGRLHEAADRLWDLTIDVNLRATARLCAAALPHLVETRGAIVNTSSAQGRAGDVGWTSYSVAKAGVEALTRSIATQYGPDGVRCNAVAPGLVATPAALAGLPDAKAAAIRSQTPLGRFAEPAEIAEVVLFLASPRASFVTGQTLAADGGLLCHMPLDPA